MCPKDKLYVCHTTIVKKKEDGIGKERRLQVCGCSQPKDIPESIEI